MEQNIYGTSAPHMKGKMTTRKIMLLMILALLPAGIFGIWNFGISAAVTILLTCVSAVLTEIIFQLLTKKRITAGDFQMLFYGLLMAYCLPPSLPWYLAAGAGAVCALLMQLSLHFFERNVVSPVILTRLLLLFAFKEEMTTYVFDGLTMATPLTTLRDGGSVDVLSMIFGTTGGCIGETSALLLCLGAIILIMFEIMDFRVAGMYLFSFAAFMAVLGGHGLSSYYLTVQLAGGGFMLTVWYLAPAYLTLPITKDGRLIYGMVLGILTGFFRLFGPAPENICFAVLIGNLLIPVIERVTVRRPFGVEKKHL